LPVHQLQEQLASGTMFVVGVFPEYRARELSSQLEGVGLKVLSSAEDAS
jgi:hypothetical protein